MKETVNLKAASKDQMLWFYDDIRSGNGGVLEDPHLIVREVTEREMLRSSFAKKRR